ncbi:MAG: ABC transporter permease [Bacilli bacterium]|nr:ABC transporter permease [Bacilli bacterium]
MIVFKNYLKIMKSFLPMICIYVVVFSAFGIMASQTGTASNTFKEAKPSIAILSEDKKSPFADQFISYMKKKANVKDIGKKEKDIKDALFFREVDLVVTIPKGFKEEFFAGKKPDLQIQKVPNSENETYARLLVQKYLDTASSYTKLGFSEEKVNQYTEKDLSKETKVLLQTKEENNMESFSIFYTFSNYTVLAIVLLIVSTIMATYQKEMLRKRNRMGTIPYHKMNLSLFLGNMVLTLGIWLIFVIIGFCLYGNILFTGPGLLLLTNFLILCFVALSIGFLLGNLVKNKEAQNGIVNVIALGSSFICGAFVTQEFLGESVLTVAKIFPSYYYIKNNNLLALYTASDLPSILINMGIMVLFIIGLLLVTNFVTWYKRKDI